MFCSRCKRNLPDDAFSLGGQFCDECEDELEDDVMPEGEVEEGEYDV